MDEWTKLNEDNRYFNWYQGYTVIKPPENHQYLGNSHQIESSALSGVVTTKYFGDDFQKDLIQQGKVYYPVTVIPPENFISDENITLHIKPGAKSGQKLVMHGKGSPHPFNSQLPNGNVIIEISVELSSENVIDQQNNIWREALSK